MSNAELVNLIQEALLKQVNTRSSPEPGLLLSSPGPCYYVLFVPRIPLEAKAHLLSRIQ